MTLSNPASRASSERPDALTLGGRPLEMAANASRSRPNTSSSDNIFRFLTYRYFDFIETIMFWLTNRQIHPSSPGQSLPRRAPPRRSASSPLATTVAPTAHQRTDTVFRHGTRSKGNAAALPHEVGLY